MLVQYQTIPAGLLAGKLALSFSGSFVSRKNPQIFQDLTPFLQSIEAPHIYLDLEKTPYEHAPAVITLFKEVLQTARYSFIIRHTYRKPASWMVPGRLFWLIHDTQASTWTPLPCSELRVQLDVPLAPEDIYHLGDLTPTCYIIPSEGGLITPYLRKPEWGLLPVAKNQLSRILHNDELAIVTKTPEAFERADRVEPPIIGERVEVLKTPKSKKRPQQSEPPKPVEALSRLSKLDL